MLKTPHKITLPFSWSLLIAPPHKSHFAMPYPVRVKGREPLNVTNLTVCYSLPCSIHLPLVLCLFANHFTDLTRNHFLIRHSLRLEVKGPDPLTLTLTFT